MSKHPTFLTEAFRAIRPGFATAIVFSFFINLLAFVGPLYMLQIYDRVLGSRNIGTLVTLTIIAAFLLIVYSLLEKIRSSVLVRLGLLFADKAKVPLFDTVLRGTLVQPGTSHVQALRDLDTVREFMTGNGLIAFCDAPWVPVFVLGCFIMHPWFGYVATGGAVLIFALALANELLTRSQLKEASYNSVIANSYASATFRNADVLYAMGMLKGLRDRWSDRHDEGLQLQAKASDRAGFSGCFEQICPSLSAGFHSWRGSLSRRQSREHGGRNGRSLYRYGSGARSRGNCCLPMEGLFGSAFGVRANSEPR